MGYDVTFHPVGLNELNHFLFDVIESPSLLEPRLSELIAAEADREVARDVFQQAFRAIEATEDEMGITLRDRDKSADRPEEDEDASDPHAAIRFLAAMVAGCLHPYWYSRGAGIFPLEFERERGESYRRLTEGRLAALEDEMEGITGNYSAGCFIPPDRVKALRGRIDATPERYRTALEERGFEALTHALDYAVSRGLGLIEATDVVVPSADMFMTRPDLMRAHYLKNISPAESAGGVLSLARVARESNETAAPSSRIETAVSSSPAWPFFGVAGIFFFLALTSGRYFLMLPAVLAAARGAVRLSDE